MRSIVRWVQEAWQRKAWGAGRSTDYEATTTQGFWVLESFGYVCDGWAMGGRDQCKEDDAGHVCWEGTWM